MNTQTERLLRSALHCDIRATPAATGIDLLRDTIPGKDWQRLIAWPDLFTDMPANYSPFSAKPKDIYWYAPYNPDARFNYDKNAMYLAACSNLPLGVSPYRWLEKFGGEPGIWQIKEATIRPEQDRSLDPIIQSFLGEWEYTPTIKLLTHLGYQVTLTGGYAFPVAKLYLSKWYERLRDARGFLQLQADTYTDDALYELKQMYAQTIAFIGVPPQQDWQVYRPDWRAMIASTARAAMLYQIAAVYQRTHLLPVRIYTDCVSYQEPAPLKIGSTPGTWKLLPAVSDSPGALYA